VFPNMSHICCAFFFCQWATTFDFILAQLNTGLYFLILEIYGLFGKSNALLKKFLRIFIIFDLPQKASVNLSS
jgi:hypothetical protein